MRLQKSEVLYRSVVAVRCFFLCMGIFGGTVSLRCRGTVLFFMRGRLFNQKRKSTTTEEQKRIILPKAPATTALLRSEGAPGEYHPPDAEAWRNSSPSFASKGGRGRRIATHYHQASHKHANTPTETNPRERAPGGAGGRREHPLQKKARKPRKRAGNIKKEAADLRQPHGIQNKIQFLAAMRAATEA